MSLGTKLVQSAQKEAALQRPFPLQAQASLPLRDGGTLSAQAQIADNDRLSKLAQCVVVARGGAAPGHSKGQANARRRAEKFAARATYLAEQLAFVECDANGAAIARSTPATMAGRGAPYFEARVTEDEITLQRFQAIGGGARQSVPFCLTDDLLARVVEDAAATLAPKG